ncbi:MAG: hypothetical protein KatS3mg101_0973 [Patescibacteria group bacterium]|nr:MAG: hypothetical protein KatS3mg101_0973 [Patescibacteria group bacterium]
MAIFNAKAPAYKKRPEVISEWATFRKGLNLILRPTEISNEEMSEAYNIMLIGSGVPTGRWGTEVFFDTGGTYVNGLGFYRSSDLTIDDVLALSNTGYFGKEKQLFIYNH